MIWNAKKRYGSARRYGNELCFVRFREKALILLPGLSDGLTTVAGKALLLAAPYRSFSGDFTVYMYSRKNDLPDNYLIREMADDQARAMRKLGIDIASVMGVSEGGMHPASRQGGKRIDS